MKDVENLLNKQVARLFLLVWPPWGEESLVDVDISIGFIFTDTPDQLCIISTDKEDMWSPCIRYETIPDFILPWDTFAFRIENWMKAQEQSDFNTEYFEVTNIGFFDEIVSHEVRSVELVKIQNTENPFGVKLMFENDYILSTPISDGNTIETSRFNRNNNIINFERLGVLEYVKVA